MVLETCGADQGVVCRSIQRQTVISQFYQMDRLVVEGGISVRGRVGSWNGWAEVLTVCRARMSRVMVRL